MPLYDNCSHSLSHTDLQDRPSSHTDCALLSGKDSLDLLCWVAHMDCSDRCIGGVSVQEDDRCDLERMDDADLLDIAFEGRMSIEDMIERDGLLVVKCEGGVVPLEDKAGWWW